MEEETDDFEAVTDEEITSYYVTQNQKLHPPTIFYRQKHAPQFDIFTNPLLKKSTTWKKFFIVFFSLILRFVMSSLGSMIFWVGIWFQKKKKKKKFLIFEYFKKKGYF